MARKELIGEARACSDTILWILVLGNHLPKDDPKHNACINIICKDNAQAFELYCNAFKITIEDDSKMYDMPEENGFKCINVEDCILEELTSDQVEQYVKNY